MKIYRLNNHFLINADLISKNDIEKALRIININSTSMIIADPPYGMKKKILNDDLTQDKLMEFNKKWFELVKIYLKNYGCFYCFGNDISTLNFYNSILRNELEEGNFALRNILTWDKMTAIGQRSAMMSCYPRADEKVLFLIKGYELTKNNSEQYLESYDCIRLYLLGEIKKTGKKLEEIGNLLGVSGRAVGHWIGKSQFGLIPKARYEVLQKEFPKCFLKPYDDLANEFIKVRSGIEGITLNAKETALLNKKAKNFTFDLSREPTTTSCIRHSYPSPKKRYGHDTAKPIELYKKLINISIEEGETVFEFFAGTGPGLMAAHELKCRYIGFELSERWCDVIIKRFEEKYNCKTKLIYED